MVEAEVFDMEEFFGLIATAFLPTKGVMCNVLLSGLI